MPITHTNAKGKTSYLHQGTTKTGSPNTTSLCRVRAHWQGSIPAGFEIYENPNAQVFLRRIPPKIITDEERQVVEDGMRKYASVQDYKIDVKGNAIVVYTADQESETFSGDSSRVLVLTSSQTQVAAIRGAGGALLCP